MVFLETGLDKGTGGASESSSARRERGMCRWWRGADKVMMGLEQELIGAGRKARAKAQSSQYLPRNTRSGAVRANQCFMIAYVIAIEEMGARASDTIRFSRQHIVSFRPYSLHSLVSEV